MQKKNVGLIKMFFFLSAFHGPPFMLKLKVTLSLKKNIVQSHLTHTVPLIKRVLGLSAASIKFGT